jgi:hypothetical protein
VGDVEQIDDLIVATSSPHLAQSDLCAVVVEVPLSAARIAVIQMQDAVATCFSSVPSAPPEVVDIGVAVPTGEDDPSRADSRHVAVLGRIRLLSAAGLGQRARALSVITVAIPRASAANARTNFLMLLLPYWGLAAPTVHVLSPTARGLSAALPGQCESHRNLRVLAWSVPLRTQVGRGVGRRFPAAPSCFGG